jgi:hypothetical protein
VPIYDLQDPTILRKTFVVKVGNYKVIDNGIALENAINMRKGN